MEFKTTVEEKAAGSGRFNHPEMAKDVAAFAAPMVVKSLSGQSGRHSSDKIKDRG
jgi:hypothetical protein